MLVGLARRAHHLQLPGVRGRGSSKWDGGGGAATSDNVLDDSVEVVQNVTGIQHSTNTLEPLQTGSPLQVGFAPHY